MRLIAGIMLFAVGITLEIIGLAFLKASYGLCKWFDRLYPESFIQEEE